MASTDRAASRFVELERALAEKPYAFGFYRALRLIECTHPDKPRMGESRRPADDPVRLSQEPNLSFAPSTLASFRPRGAEHRARLGSYFLGLFGPNGPLPIHLTEYARDRLRNAGDSTFIAFADLFHHRMLALFYRAWASGQPAVSYDRPPDDRYAAYVGSLVGIGMPGLRDRDAMPDLAKLYYSGRMSLQSRNAEGLRAVLADFFDMPVDIEEFIGHWMEIPVDARGRLGVAPSTATLGLDVTIGTHIWECQQKFRILVGPVNFEDYERLLPGGDTLARLVAVVRNYIGDELIWDLNLILEQEEVPALRLGQVGRLGWSTWLSTAPRGHDAADLHLVPTEYLDCEAPADGAG